MTQHPLISVRNLNVHIDEQHILKNINISIPDKRVTSIIGRMWQNDVAEKIYPVYWTTPRMSMYWAAYRWGDEDIYAPDAEVTHIQKMGLLSRRPCLLPCRSIIM